jgi:hypothetical protein
MSHFTVTVVVPPERATDSDSLNAYLNEALERYSEQREVEPYIAEDGGKSTYNPESKWDWWVIGGRWRGAYLFKSDANPTRLIVGESGAFGNDANDFFDEYGTRQVRVDGGPVGMLDLAGMREEARRKAEQDWDEYQSVVEGTEEMLSWSHFVDRVEGARNAMPKGRYETILDAENVVNERFGVPKSIPVDDIPAELNYGPDGTGDGPYWIERNAALEALKSQKLLDGDGGTEPPPADDDDPFAALFANRDKEFAGTRYAAYAAQLKVAEREAGKKWDAECGYSIDQARKEYHDQERIKKLRAAPCYKGHWDGPEDQFDGISREDCAKRAADRAVPGYATITADGEWVAPGRMGWFAVSSHDDTSYEVYARKVNEMIDKLPPETYLVQLDCHI